MSRSGEADDPRRRLLVQALAAGFFGGGLATREAMAQFFGATPSKLPPGPVDLPPVGRASWWTASPPRSKTKIGGRSTLETGKNGEVVYAVGQSAFILRAESRVDPRDRAGRTRRSSRACGC